MLSVGGKTVANDGTIEFRRNERTVFDERVQEFYIGDTVPLEVLRDGKIVPLPIKLTVPVNATRLVPRPQYDMQPSYFIVGGLIFQPLTANYLGLWEKDEAPANLRSCYYFGQPRPDRRNIILMSSVLAD
jgi:hypothetical protein